MADRIILRFEGMVEEIKRKWFWCRLKPTRNGHGLKKGQELKAELTRSLVKKEQLKYFEPGALFYLTVRKGKNKNYSDLKMRVRFWTKKEIKAAKKKVQDLINFFREEHEKARNNTVHCSDGNGHTDIPVREDLRME